MNFVFVDTNIIVYARDRNEPEKQAIAGRWLAELARQRTGRISWQVLTEFYRAATHPRKLGLTGDLVRADVDALAVWNPLAPDTALFRAAWTVQDRHDLSWWDALIVAAALRQRCTTLLSEDLRHGWQIDGTPGGGPSLTVINPFAPDAPNPPHS